MDHILTQQPHIVFLTDRQNSCASPTSEHLINRSSCNWRLFVWHGIRAGYVLRISYALWLEMFNAPFVSKELVSG